MSALHRFGVELYTAMGVFEVSCLKSFVQVIRVCTLNCLVVNGRGCCDQLPKRLCRGYPLLLRFSACAVCEG